VIARGPGSACTGTEIDVSVVVVSFNTRDLLRRCLASVPLACGNLRFEILVADNESHDGSAEMVRHEFPHATLLEGHGNIGFAKANNLAFRQCRGAFLFCLNPDAEAHPGSIETLVDAMRLDPSIGYAGPRLLNPDGSHQWSAYRFHTVLSPLYSWSMLGLDRRHPRSRHCMSLHHAHGVDAAIDAEWLLGAALLVRREAYEACGGFDESFFLYAEEIEWCARLAAGGWRGRYLPAATVTHVRSASTSHRADAHAFHGHDPTLLIEAHRHLARKTLGTVGMLAQQTLHVAGLSLALARNLWPMPGRSEAKARAATLWIRHLLRPARSQKARRGDAAARPSPAPAAIAGSS
jgi:N-acetylglucosaminyl-diphospho-decaprenol L-rhamnosyltransferase